MHTSSNVVVHDVSYPDSPDILLLIITGQFWGERYFFELHVSSSDLAV